MSYTVLARKYRSRTFDDLVGQDAIATTLRNAVTDGRVHHGYLFTGTRGVGKTSTARVLAKALNCLSSDGPTPTPCDQCESCLRIADGEDIDVIEIDAASNTGVDNIRDLRDNTAYRPARARFKVYIIDEVHMLSTGAFNALLKTLEEPPEHVKFILATTEIQKVPATIVSRCQRFDFRSIGVDAIAGHLASILKLEGIEADEAALRRIARLANGSMRDGLSLLDQVLSFGQGKLSADTLDDVLPCAHDETVVEMIDAAAESDAAGALRCVEQSLGAGQTMARFCDLTIEHLRNLMVIRVCGDDTDLVDLPDTLRGELARQAARFDGPTFVYMISLMEQTRRSVKSSTSARALLDAAVVRLAMAEQFSDVKDLLERLDGQAGGEAPAGSAKAGLSKPTSTITPRKASTRRSTESVRKPGRSAEATSSATSPGKPTKNAEPASAIGATEKATSGGGKTGAGAKTGGATQDDAGKSRAGSRRRGSSKPNLTVSSADTQRVRNNPVVRQTLELFDGTLAGVERVIDSTMEAAVEGDEGKSTNDGDD